MRALLKLMQTTGDILDKISASIAAATFAVMSIIVIIQVISRCFFSHSFQWAEEMARYLFIWSTMTASASAIRAHMHIGVDVLVNYVTGRLQFAMKLAAQFFMLATAAVLVIYGGLQSYETFASGQMATSFPVSAGVLYLSFPVAGLLIFWFCLTQVLELFCDGDFRKTDLQFVGQER